LAAWTASIARVRMVLMHVASIGCRDSLITGFLSTAPDMGRTFRKGEREGFAENTREKSDYSPHDRAAMFLEQRDASPRWDRSLFARWRSSPKLARNLLPSFSSARTLDPSPHPATRADARGHRE